MTKHLARGMGKASAYEQEFVGWKAELPARRRSFENRRDHKARIFAVEREFYGCGEEFFDLTGKLEVMVFGRRGARYLSDLPDVFQKAYRDSFIKAVKTNRVGRFLG